MSATQVIEGTLRPDGTLEVTDKLALPPGRVRVTVETVPAPPQLGEDWWSYLQRARAELEQTGATFSTGQQVNDYIDQLRSESDKADAIYWEKEWVERHRGDKPC
jgi:hypothetical protein